MNPLVQVAQMLFQSIFVLLPRQSIYSRGCLPF